MGEGSQIEMHANLQKVAAKPQRSATALCNHANKHLGERERSGLGVAIGGGGGGGGGMRQ